MITNMTNMFGSVMNKKSKVKKGSSYWKHEYYEDGRTKKKSISPDGIIEEYDRLGNVTKSVVSESKFIEYEYTQDGKVLSAKHSDGRVFKNEYDSVGRKIKKETPSGNYEWKYDDKGNITYRSEPDGSTWEFGYNEQNNLYFAKMPCGDKEKYLYDDQNRLSIKDTSIWHITYKYNQEFKLIESEITDKRISGPNSCILKFSYSDKNLLKSISLYLQDKILFHHNIKDRDNANSVASEIGKLGDLGKIMEEIIYKSIS